MTLRELVNPVFLFVVTLRRKIARNRALDYSEIKREILSLFQSIETKAASHALTDRWNRARVALTYLVDEVAIMEPWSGAEMWNDHCLEVEYLGHSEKMRGVWFYEQEYDYAMRSGDREMMEILYLCLCLGFEGRYRGQTVQLNNHVDNLYARLPNPLRDAGAEAKLTEEAYHVDATRNDPRSPMRIASVIAVFAGIFVSYFVINHVLYNAFLGELQEMVARL